MQLFKRVLAKSRLGDVGGFWVWWDSARERIATAISNGNLRSLVAEISDQVQRVDPGLAWEVAPGSVAQNALVVSPEGNPAIRLLAVEWLEAAPPADDVWEYHASRPPRQLGTVGVGQISVDLREMRAIAVWNSIREVLNVSLWHSIYPGLSLKNRQRFGFLFLDGLLGEDDVERWIGSVDFDENASRGLTPEQLRTEVGMHAATATGDVWVLIERADKRNDAVVVANAALKHIDYPTAAHHLVVTIQRGMDHLAGPPKSPGARETTALNAAEAELVAALEAGGGVYAGRVTERRQRRLHFACVGREREEQIFAVWAERFRRFGPRVQVDVDPAWTFREDLVG